MSEIDFSMIVTAHNEGLIAHKTIRSVFEALDELKKNDYTYEIIVHIDNGDKDTLNYFRRYENKKDIRIFKNNFGDTAPSRNFALSKARGKYVGFFDGDDLMSSNWLINAIRVLENSKEEVVVHPEAILAFGINQPYVLTLQGDSRDDDPLVLFGENRWGSVLVAKKETLEKVPYRTLKNGYGHEDYVFNVEAIERGILHKIAKETVLFYRRSDHSRLSFGNEQRVIIPAMKMFDFESMRKFDGLKNEGPRQSLMMRGYGFYKRMRENEKINRLITPVARIARRKIDEGKKKDIPSFVKNEWVKINHIESQLYPYKNILRNVTTYSAEEYLRVGEAYARISKSITKLPDYVFLVPWLVRGGADKVLINYIKALKEIHPEWHFVVIATLPVKHTWGKMLPEGVDFIDFGKVAANLTPAVQDKLMSGLITQLRCKNLHIINSEFAYLWVRNHKKLVKNNYNLNISLFAYEYIAGSNQRAVFSYDDPYLFEIYDAVKNIFTDNAAMIKYTLEHNGFDGSKMKVHYQPVLDLSLTPAKEKLLERNKLKVLVAGRIVPVKLPELVAEIGRKVDARKISIDIYGSFDPDVDKNIFKNIPAIKYCGAYDGFSSIPTEKYDIFLYVSLTDGMPNVILEATAAGLPIIASNDGGVGEFIENNKTGILIEDYLDYKPYVEALNKVLSSPDVLPEYVKNAQRLLLKRHSWQDFVKTVKRDIG